MAKSLVEILEKLNIRIRDIMHEKEKLQAENQRLTAENLELRERTQEAMDARDRALLDAEYLRVSHRLAESPDSIIETRRRITGLIRNIDRCLEMLKE